MGHARLHDIAEGQELRVAAEASHHVRVEVLGDGVNHAEPRRYMASEKEKEQGRKKERRQSRRV